MRGTCRSSTTCTGETQRMDHTRHSFSRTTTGCPAFVRSAALALLALLPACSGGGGSEGGGTSGGGGGSGGGNQAAALWSGPSEGVNWNATTTPLGRSGPTNPLEVVQRFTVRNESNFGRRETIRASIPFVEGDATSLDTFSVEGLPTSWLVLQRWADGTVRVAQAQFTDTLQPGQLRTYDVVRSATAVTGPFVRHPWVQQSLAECSLGAEVSDTFDVRYRAILNGDGEVVQESPFVQVRRYRTYHLAVEPNSGIGRDFLSSTFYVTEFREQPIVLVDWVLGNDYHGADSIPAGNVDPNMRPLGAVDVNSAKFLARGYHIAHPYRAGEEQVGGLAVDAEGYATWQVLQNSWLDDGQTLRRRFVLGVEDPLATTAELDLVRDTAVAMVVSPVFGLATHANWALSGAAGLMGGPVAPPADAWQRAESEYVNWATAAHFGPFGSHGDPKRTGTTGTPRNHPLSPELAHAIQANHHRLLVKLEQMAWIQAVRPYHLFGLRVGATQDILLWDGIPVFRGSRDLSRESLGRRALWANDPYAGYRTRTVVGYNRAHGWDHFDHEHWSTDLLFDYWTISGDAWAKEELRQLGETLKGLMRLQGYNTAYVQAVRAEGWTMQGFVQVHLATGDASIRDYALRRALEVIDSQRMKAHTSRAVSFAANYPATLFPGSHKFFMPWQHGSILYGFLAAYRFFQDPVLLEIAEDVVRAVDYGWVKGFQDPRFGYVANGLRYYVPVEVNGTPTSPEAFDTNRSIGPRWGDSPLGGAHTFLIVGLHALAELTSRTNIRDKALEYGSALFPGNWDNNMRWSKWHYCMPLRYAPGVTQ
ncbi:MAG: hypothetical protein RIT25_3147 [Planctomycetota bacterium]